MSLIDDLVAAQRKLLTGKGFDEDGLNSPDKPGWLLRQLRYNLGLAIRGAEYQSEPYHFELKTVGFFNDDKDYILFNLHYCFDPIKNDLSIFKLGMGYNKRSLTLELHNQEQLPHSSQAISMFSKPQLLVRPARRPAPPPNAPKFRKGKSRR